MRTTCDEPPWRAAETHFADRAMAAAVRDDLRELGRRAASALRPSGAQADVEAHALALALARR